MNDPALARFCKPRGPGAAKNSASRVRPFRRAFHARALELAGLCVDRAPERMSNRIVVAVETILAEQEVLLTALATIRHEVRARHVN